MFDLIKSVISAGGYKLADIQYKIKKLYLMGDLDESQMNELMALASLGVSTDAERPATLQLIQTLADEIKALTERVEALENSDVPIDPDNPEPPIDPEEPVPYPEWKPWDGISKDYQNGAIVSHNGELWQSIFEGQNVWEPGTVGTESMWVKYNP